MTIRDAFPTVPTPARRVLAADTLSAVGSGMTLPFLVVYLHQVRGLGLGQAGAALACLALAGFAGNPVGGWLADRVGPARAVAFGLLTAGAGAWLLAEATSPTPLFAATALTGLGAAIAWPAQDALLARLTDHQQRSGIFALRHMTLNVGLGAGAVLAALVVDAAVPGSFVTLFLLDAASFGVAALVLSTLRAPGAGAEPALADDAGGFRTVLRDRAFLRAGLLTAVLVTVGFGAFQIALPLVATGPAGVDPSWLAVAFAANTVTVVVAQLGVLRLVAAWRRTRAIAWSAAATAFCWALVLAGGAGGGAAWFVAAAVVFGLGETLFSPTVPAIVNDIAPERLRGRYNGALTVAYTAGFALGPLLCGYVGGLGATPLCLALIAGAALAAVLARRLARHLPDTADRIGPPPGHARPEPAGTPHPV